MADAAYSEFSRRRIREAWEERYGGEALLRRGVLKMYVTKWRYLGPGELKGV